MKNKKTLWLLLSVVIVSVFIIILANSILGKKLDFTTDNPTVKKVAPQIISDGKIASQNEATLHFQTGGKLTRVYVREGDTVRQGQTIASLDTYALQRQLTASLNTYRSVRDSFDQNQQNSSNGVASGQQRYALDVTTKANLSGPNEDNVINDMVKRLADQSQANLDNSVINVELANYALQLSSLNSPFDGVIVHEDVNQQGVNITPLTSFVVMDPDLLIFRAQVNEQDIDYISVGSSARVSLNGDNKSYLGYVTKIYPEKITLATGQSYYNVEISGQFSGTHYSQSGSVQIQSSAAKNTLLVPRWTLLNNQQIWVKDGTKAILKNVKVGKTHGNEVEILGGLSESDRIITNPQLVVQNKYPFL